MTIFITIVEIDNPGCGRVTRYMIVYIDDDSARTQHDRTHHEVDICTGRSLLVFGRDSRGSPKFVRLKRVKKIVKCLWFFRVDFGVKNGSERLRPEKSFISALSLLVRRDEYNLQSFCQTYIHRMCPVNTAYKTHLKEFSRSWDWTSPKQFECMQWDVPVSKWVLYVVFILCICIVYEYTHIRVSNDRKNFDFNTRVGTNFNFLVVTNNDWIYCTYVNGYHCHLSFAVVS